MTALLATYQKLTRWPLGHWLFTRAVCFKAPYFASISPRFTGLEKGRCEATIPRRVDRKKLVKRMIY